MPSRATKVTRHAAAVIGYILAAFGVGAGAYDLGRASIRLVSYEDTLARVVDPVSPYGLETHNESYSVRYEFQAGGGVFSGVGEVRSMSVLGDSVQVLYKRSDPNVNFVHDTNVIDVGGVVLLVAGLGMYVLVRRFTSRGGRQSRGAPPNNSLERTREG